MNSYRLYGLSVGSHWRLRCPTDKGAEPVIELTPGAAEMFERLAREAGPPRGPWYDCVLLREGYYIRYGDVFQFLISSNGDRISGRGSRKVSLEAFRAHLLGDALSFALVGRGIEPLHATAVVVDGGAVGFLGDSGYGKSSLAGEFLRAGHLLVTDDLLVLRDGEGGLLVHPGPPRIKLYPEMARRVAGRSMRGVPMNPLTRKLILPLGRGQACPKPVPLRALYVLTRPTARQRGNGVTIRGLFGQRAFLALVRHTFNTDVTDAARLRRHFVLAARVASAVPVKLLSYPRLPGTMSRLPAVRQAVLTDLQRR